VNGVKQTDVMSADDSAADGWENEGGANSRSYGSVMGTWPASDDHQITSLPHFEHKEREDDDLGLPEHPIYANYPKYLWKGHTRSGGVQAPNASTENTDTVVEKKR
jgi:hypothetical protein